jgi:hypothetical protein
MGSNEEGIPHQDDEITVLVTGYGVRFCPSPNRTSSSSRRIAA